MNESFAAFHESNPFSTRFTAPGKTPFFFERSFLHYIKASRPAKFEELFTAIIGAGEDVRTNLCIQYLVDQFQTHSCRGQIIGAHGSGKTTLMCALREALEKQGYEIFTWTLHDNSRFLPDVFWYELQLFLQSVPIFLPSKCMLPPPVMSPEEFREQQRAVSGLETGESRADDLEEFRVADGSSESQASSNGDNEKKVERSWSLGVGAEGSIGLTEKGAAELPGHKGDGRVKFAPFPELNLEDTPAAQPPRDDDSDEAYDSVEIVSGESDEDPVAEFQEDLQLDAANARQSRSFFDKKALFFDGFEQLSYVNRIILRTFCRMNRLGLLITTHTPAIGMPVLFRTIPSAESLGELLNYLLEDEPEAMEPSDAELETLLKNHKYNVREILFSFYDAYEDYRSARSSSRTSLVRKYPR